MNRCEICDDNDLDNPSANIKDYEIGVSSFDRGERPIYERRCLLCHNTVQEAVEDLSIGDDDFVFAEK